MKKVVLSPSLDGGTALRISQVRSGSEAHALGGELHLGSQDLIRFASYALDHMFSVASFMLADAYFTPMEPDDQTEASVEMVDILKTFGGDELEAAMRDDFDGIYVIGVNLVAPSTGLRISVRRKGYVETSIVQEAEQLLASAWRELHLS